MPLAHELEEKPKLPEVFTFELSQPDDSKVAIDLSAYGERGDLAFTADGEYFSAYWTSESAILVDLLQRMRSTKNLPESVAQIHTAIKELTDSNYSRTTQSEGKIDTRTVELLLAEGTENPRSYRMFQSGDDMLIIDIARDDGVHITSEREWDEGERRRKEFVIPDDELWRFVAGMMARSYSDDGREYPELTRYATSQYDNALRLV